MSMLEMPLPSDVNQTLRVSLEGTTYEFLYTWNERDDHWYLEISSLGGEVLRSGIRVVVDWDLLSSSRSQDLPPGQLFFFDLSAKQLQGEDPGVDDLGSRVFAYYIESA